MTTEPARADLRAERVQIAVADLLRSLGHPVRIQVVELLCAGPCSGTELREQTGETASGLSRQTRSLRAAGLIKSSGPGANQTYELANPAVAELLRLSDTVAERLDGS